MSNACDYSAYINKEVWYNLTAWDDFVQKLGYTAIVTKIMIVDLSNQTYLGKYCQVQERGILFKIK